MASTKLVFNGQMLNVSYYDRTVNTAGRRYVYREAAVTLRGRVLSVRAQTDKEALAKLGEKLSAQTPAKVETVTDSAAFDQWAERLTTYTQDIGRAESYVTNLNDFRRHIQGTWFGCKPLADVTTTDVNLVIAQVAAKGYYRGKVKTNYSPQFSNLLRQFIRRVFNHARASGVKNLVNPVTRETAIKNLTHRRKVALTKDQIRILIDSLDNLQDRLLIAIGLMAVRPGEVCGLKTTDIDLEAGKITISRQVRYRRIQGRETLSKQDAPLKTTSSNREVPIVQWLRPLLEERLTNGDPCEYLVHNGRCKPLDSTYISKRVPKLLTAAQSTPLGKKLPMIRAYWLKHTGITEMHNAGIPLSTISAITGVSAATLLKHYVQPHGFEERSRLMSEALAY